MLAEKANQLYLDTTYADLITFEEDIAKISAMILVIAESAGSLAELGAFASNETIRRSLTILMQSEYADKESFIRYGPVERIRNDDEERVGFYPWRLNKKDKVVKLSASPHVKNIVDFINDRLSKTPKTIVFSSNKHLSDFIILYWILFLSLALPLGKLASYARNMIAGIDKREVQRKLYCMQLAGWVKKEKYSHLDYYFCCYDMDPIHYTFRADVAERDSIRRKAGVTAVIQRELSLPKHVREVAAQNRKLRPK